MNRRRFLSWTTLGLVGTQLPAWAASLQDADPQLRPRLRQDPAVDPVLAALRNARGRGKPLLVLIVPRNETDGYERGRHFGLWFEHADERALADLALCDVICTPIAELAPHCEGLPKKREPLMVLVETGGGPWRARAIDGKLSKLKQYGRGAPNEALEREVRERSDAQAALLRRALVPDRDALDRRFEQARSRLTAEELATLEGGVARPAELPAPLVDRGAALLRTAANENEALEPVILAVLAASTIGRLRKNPPAGAKWASSTGCGTHIEGQGGDAGGRTMACGRGFVPKLTRRFLHFYTE